MRTFYLVLFSFIAMTTFGQNTPVMSKVTADWCPSCGSWGWELMEELKSEFEDGPGFVLGVHHSGDLSNPTSEWWKDVLNSSGQPRFYMNNERLSVSSGNWSDEIDNVVTQAADLLATGGSVDFSHDRILMEGQTLNVPVNVSAFPSNGEYYIGNYVYEDNVVAFQSQQGSDASHPNVLRSTMGPDYPGNIITANGVMEFIMDIPSEWNRDELGVLTVAWEKNGDNFNILGAAGRSVHDHAYRSFRKTKIESRFRARIFYR